MHTKADTSRRELSPDESDESALIERRRAAASSTPADRRFQGTLGLALSGGGIRSATFGLGLLRALAKKETLHHVDYLSTVSGGGYIGAAYTRLYGPQRTAKEVEEGLKRDDSVFVWWLRNNGRYLTPAGFTDVMQALAYIFRGSLASHFEFAMLVACAVAVVLLPGIWFPELRVRHMSAWWWVAAASIWYVFHHIFAYWFWRSPAERGVAAVDAIVALGAAGIAAYEWNSMREYLATHWPGWHSLAAVGAYAFILAPASGMLVHAYEVHVRDRRSHQHLSIGAARLKHTKGLALALKAILLFVAAGALDVATFEIASWLEHRPGIVAGSLPLVGVVTAIAHWVQSHWKAGKEMAKEAMRRLGLSMTLNILGLVFLALVVATWTTAAQWLFQFPHDWVLDFAKAAGGGARWVLVFGLPIFYVAATLRGIETLNLSSLHNFYRARLERAYVSTGNSKRFDPSILAPKQAVQNPRDRMRVAASMDGDDIDLAQHRPHAHGGPLHLVNCCINQTVDDRTDAYNADRKGVALTVSALGVETGTKRPDAKSPPDKLSKWVAVSGAAASSGMGSQTTPGAAALLFLSALRLGYWQRKLDERRGDGNAKPVRPALLLAECFARFPGLGSAQWYLSDGGHFENTAVYALLKRKVELIVVADCGADPGYRFEDVENLVRKAAIDYAADIRFFAPAPAGSDLAQAIGLPGDITQREGTQWLLLGCIDYGDGRMGTIVVVKPRVVPGLMLDTARYAAQHDVFPQQTTGDQFFDEAQWEAYHRLGLHLGQLLTPANLKQLQDWATGHCAAAVSKEPEHA